MILEIIGDTLDVIGKILIALAVIAVHETFVKEHKFDSKVSKTVHKEHILVIIGTTLIIIGYALRQLGKHAT